VAIDAKLWEECQAVVPDSIPDQLPQALGTVDGNRAIVADFNAIKIEPDKAADHDEPHMDAIEGANDLEAAWARREFGKKVLLVDSNIHPRCWAFILLHEGFERRLMSQGMSYDAAHERANRMEREARGGGTY
jgi:hypothetical protein